MMDFTEYIAIDAVNWSSLKPLEKSALAYRWQKDHPRTESTPIQVEGQLLHCMVLEPDAVSERYIMTGALPEPDMTDVLVYPGRRAGNDWDLFKYAHRDQTILIASEYEPERKRRGLSLFEQLSAGKEVISPRMWEECRAMADAIRAHSLAARLLSSGKSEQVIRWTDPMTGLLCKARLDYVGGIDGDEEDFYIADLKSARSLDPRAWWGAVARYGYHAQMAHYAAGIRSVCEVRDPVVYIIAVEKVAPYDVGVFRMTSMDLAAGERKVAGLLAKLKACLDSDTWPGQWPGDEAYPSELPEYIHDDDLTQEDE